ncbi:MAG: tetratricopeptide repeat protein [Dehalococcoidia bacterium]
MNRRHRVDSAIAHALARRWDLAAEENRGLLEDDPTDVEAANRLGKALTELGDTSGAIEAYEQAIKIDATNAIARKNLARLEEQRKSKRPTRTAPKARAGANPSTPRVRRVDVATESLRTAPLIEDFGKAADLTLQRVNARASTLVSTGDPAELELTSSGVAVKAAGGAILGHIDPRTGLRLKRMIEGGNKYSVVILRATEGQVEVHVRETAKHPSLVGQASFLPQAGDKRRAPRAYTKSSVLQYERVDDEDDYDTDDEEEADIWRPRPATAFAEATDDDDDDDEAEEDEDFTSDVEDDAEDTSFAEDDDAALDDDDEASDTLDDDEDGDD